MEPTDPVAFVRYYNAWRVGGDMDMPDPSKITRALTELCDKVERLQRELEQERQLVASLQALATTDHESKEAFIRRCRQTLGINEAVNPP